MASAPITTSNRVVLTLVDPFCALGVMQNVFTKTVVLERLWPPGPETALLDYLIHSS